MRKLGFIVDTTSGRYTDLAGSPVELPEVAIGDTVLLIGHFREALAANLSDLDLTGATALRAHVKKDRLASDTTTLTFQDAYNGGNAAAWESLSAGKVTWLVSFATAALTSALGTAAYVDIWLEFSWLDATGTIPQTLAQIPIRLVPQIDTGAAGTPPPAAPTYYTATEVLQILATTYQGAWDIATAYTTGQTVSYAGGFFLAMQGSTGSAPDPEASTADWAVMAAPGAPGAPGEDGDDGTDGRTIHTVTGAPASLTGVDGDYAIDPAAQVMYGPKAVGAWPAGVSIRGADGSSDWTAWQNDDMDAGTEVLSEWTAPTASAVWKVIGRISKGGAMIAFEALVAVCVVDDGYGGYARTVEMTVQHTAEIGDCSVLSWAAAGVLYTDYDAGSGKVRLRVNLAAGAANWTAAGKWMRAA